MRARIPPAFDRSPSAHAAEREAERRLRRGRRTLAGAFGVVALGLAGCGHPATREECDQIITRTAEIELHAQHVTDPSAIAERVAAAKASKGDALLDRCVGRRITDRALACVRQAASAEQVDRCLD